MVNGCLIIQAIRDIVHQNISQDTNMALYENMLLINEQEYLTFKNARYRVGEPEGEADQYAQYHMGRDDEEYPEFGDAYSYYGDDDDDDDDYGDDDLPLHPFRYEYQPTPHVENAPLAVEEVVDVEQAQDNVEEVEQIVENAVEELHAAQENVEHAENDVQLEEAENQREEAVERLAAAEEQLDTADDVLADVQAISDQAMAVPTPDESIHDPMSLQTAQYRPAPDDSEIDLDISDVRPEPAIAQDDPSTWQLAERLGKLWNPHGKTKQFTAAHDTFARRVALKMKAPEPEIPSKFKQRQALKGKGLPMDTSLDVEYDPVNRSLIEMIPHPQYPPTPSNIYSEEPSEGELYPPTSPEPIESILERHQGPRLTPRDEDYNISYQDIIIPPRQKDLTVKPVIRQASTSRYLSRTPPGSPETVQEYDPNDEPTRASTPKAVDIRNHIAMFEPLIDEYLRQVAPQIEQRENEYREQLAERLHNTFGASEFYVEGNIMDNIIENTITTHPIELPVVENVEQELHAMTQYVHDQENARERFIDHNKTRYNIPYEEHVVDLDAVVPPQMQLTDAERAELNAAIENMRDPYKFQNLSIHLEEQVVQQYENENRAPPRFLPPAAIVAPQYRQHWRDDDETLAFEDDFDTEFDISFGNVLER